MSIASVQKINVVPFAYQPRWQIETYQEYHDYINLHSTKCLEVIVNYCEANPGKNHFLWPVEIGSVQFLAGVFPSQSTIKIASKQLGRELTLIHCNEEGSSNELMLMEEFASSIAEIPSHNSPLSIEVISHAHDLPLFNDDSFISIHEKTNILADQLVEKIQSYKTSAFEKLSNFSLDMIANYMLIRIHVLKFLAILPCLDHDQHGHEVKRIFLETLRRLIADSTKASKKKLKGQRRALPNFYLTASKVILALSELIPAMILSFVIKKTIEVMAKRFIAGKDISNANQSLISLMESNREATIDQLGELVVSKHESDLYTQKVIEIIQGLGQTITKGECNAAGINKAHVSIKVTALTHDFKPQDFDYSYETVAPRLIKILSMAQKCDVFVNIDAEHYHYRDCVFEIYKKVLLEVDELKSFSKTGIVVQAYLKDAYLHFQEVLNLAKSRNIRMPIRLVKGAYWDAETIEAEAHNFESPQFINKEETDIHFRQLVFKTLEQGEFLQLALASHNIKDHCFAEVIRDQLFPNSPIVEHQCLHMTYEGLSVGMSKLSWATRNYIPVGDLLVGMAYLVRRIMENSSQVGVLTMMRSHRKSLDPKDPTLVLKHKRDEMKVSYESSIKAMTREFKNIYPLRTYLSPHLERVNTSLTNDLDHLKNGQLFSKEGNREIISSSNPDLVLGKVTHDQISDVDQKILALFSGYMNETWSSDLLKRTSCLYRLADLLLFNREKLTTLIMLEAGKTIDEAVADVDEAIDFIHFYIREQIELEQTNKVASKGVIGVIAPWNFPLAIPCGMAVAGLAAGNTVILKPAEQTMLIAVEFLKLARMAGIGENIFNISLGEAEVGKSIVSHELINGIVFTGSKQVGEQIYKQISTSMSSTKYSFEQIPKFAITEMGGKNAIIVTNNCELDETISGIIYSAFAHAGQKCSAASRIIIDNKIKDNFIKRFTAAVQDLKVGSSLEHSTLINPLITRDDQQRVKSLVKRATEEVSKFGGKVIIDRSHEVYDNFCVGPSVFELPAHIALREDTMAKHEVFGPLVHIIGYEHLDEAIKIFNSTHYALTGGIYCQSQDDIDYLAPRLEAGNLYINRPNTGARVAIEPFGGFKMSGTGPKAGGVEYLRKFNRYVERKKISHTLDFSAKQNIKDYIAQYSKLSGDRRRENTLKLVDVLVEQCEFLFGQITEKNKNKLINLKQSIEDGVFDLETRVFPQRMIPGQNSYGVRDMVFGSGCLIDSSTKLNIELVLDLLTNLLVGNGVSIISTNDSIFNKWKQLVDWAQNCGFSNFNLSASILTEVELEDFLKESKLKFCILSSVNMPEKYKKLMMDKVFERYMIRLFYAGENKSIDESIKKFTHCRSFAINTMRHGAPLELNI